MTLRELLRNDRRVLRALTAMQPRITAEMSVNAIVRTYPETARVFERHGICCGIDACDCLDELAWRRGLDVKGLVSELQGAAAAEKTEELVASRAD